MRNWPAAWLVVCCVSVAVAAAPEPADEVRDLRAAFHERSGVELVFEASELPDGVYHDLMVPLAADRQSAALRIAEREAAKLPQHFLRDVGLRAIGVFESCASLRGDGFRAYDKKLQGYRYYGIYNGRDALAAAYYSDEQLPLTLHHEIFHHIDGATDPANRADRRLATILDGKNLYPAPKISAADLAKLKKISTGLVLEEAVSDYAKKNPAEDKAETARYLLSALPDSLVQVTERPELSGSQRLLHVLDKYRRALGGKGPTVAWFVDVALDRQRSVTPAKPASADQSVAAVKKSAARILAARLRSFGSRGSQLSDKAVRKQLQEAEKLGLRKLDTLEAVELAHAAAAATQQLLKTQIRPGDDDRAFVVPGREDADGVNWELRGTLKNFGHDAARLAAIATPTGAASDAIRRTQLENLRLVARLYVFIAEHWQVTDKTRQVFEDTRDQFSAAVGKTDPVLEASLNQHDLKNLAESISPQGSLRPLDNPYMKNVDAEIDNLALRSAIRCVQPACVRLGGGSGVNLARNGRILTAAHVAGRLNNTLTAEFPDGRKLAATCIAIDDDLDVAICSVASDDRLPFARIAATAPKQGAHVVCIGQPGTSTPDGEPTGYQPFHVSTGKIRGFAGKPLGNQTLGRTKHDAWTYWGHSGSPLFDEQGRIVAMHNSWDSKTAMRHAVTWQALVKFVRDQGLEAAIVGKK